MANWKDTIEAPAHSILSSQTESKKIDCLSSRIWDLLNVRLPPPPSAFLFRQVCPARPGPTGRSSRRRARVAPRYHLICDKDLWTPDFKTYTIN